MADEQNMQNEEHYRFIFELFDDMYGLVFVLVEIVEVQVKNPVAAHVWDDIMHVNISENETEIEFFDDVPVEEPQPEAPQQFRIFVTKNQHYQAPDANFSYGPNDPYKFSE